MIPERQPVVLIVDDDPVVRLLAREALEQSGWSVEEAENGRLGLDAFARCRPDLVLLDVMMPELDGFAVCAELRRLPEGLHTPILIMTGLEDYQSITQAYEAGATEFFVKPINGLLLGHRVRYMLRAGQAMQDLRDSQVELVKAWDAAMEGARLKSEFLSTISHELRTPLNGIIGMDNLLLDSALAPEQRDYAETIKKSATTLLDIVMDILDFSKFDAGRVTLNRLECSLSAVMEENLALFQERASQKGLRLHGEIEPAVSERVWADPIWLGRVLQALLSNAMKFTQQGEVCLRIEPALWPESVGPVSDGSAGCQETHAPRIRFSVVDTGIGISDAFRARLFQPFTQADGSNRRAYGGTGLGLALAKQLVELMGGRIDFESEPGKGSRFWFELPPAQEGVERAPSDGPSRVLVLDADIVSQAFVARTLKKLGCRVETARKVEELSGKRVGDGWKLLLADSYVLGREAARAPLRALTETSPRIAIIGLGQVSSSADSYPDSLLHVDGYIQKPITVEAIIAAVVRWLPEARQKERLSQ